jgi:predicted dehydrogenase
MNGQIRYGVVGIKGVGQWHLQALRSVPSARLVAVADLDRTAGLQTALDYHCAFYPDYYDMVCGAGLDAVSICTPHLLHGEVAVAALENGLHVLSEKPIAAEVGEADRMVATARKRGLTLAVVFQRRWDPLYRRAAELVEEGAVGDLIRVALTATALRTMAYYRAAPWRGTWSGEGGGVLLNQAAHDLDVYQSLAGQPRSVIARSATLLHTIEVEDSAAAIARHDGGALAVIQVSTVEAPGEYRLDVVGERGRLLIARDALTVWKHRTPIRSYVRASPDLWSVPASDVDTITTPSGKPTGAHADVLLDFTEAILQGREPLVNGEEAIRSLELANAMTLSAATGAEVNLPLDRQRYNAFLRSVREAPPPARVPPDS